MSTPVTLEAIVGQALAAQIRLVPQPGDVRGHVLAKIGKWVPEGQDVEQWLLANHKPAEAPKVPARKIQVRCQEEGTVTGRCSYTANYTASGHISIREDALREMIRECGSREEAVEAFKEWARDNHEASDSFDEDSCDYDNYDADDRDTDETSNDAEEVIEAYLDEHPELLLPTVVEVSEEDDAQEEINTDQPMPF